MKIQQAIEKSIEGGWRPEGEVLGLYDGEVWVKIRWAEKRECMLGSRAGSYGEGFEDIENGLVVDMPAEIEGMFLDPFFWQALGKSMGWGGSHYGDNAVEHECNNQCVPNWYHKWHALIDHLAEGGSIE